LIKAKFKIHGKDVAGEEKVATDGKIDKTSSNKNVKEKRKDSTKDSHKENLLFVEPVRRKRKKPSFWMILSVSSDHLTSRVTSTSLSSTSHQEKKQSFKR